MPRSDGDMLKNVPDVAKPAAQAAVVNTATRRSPFMSRA
jgi:hypothetical protein